MSLKRQGSTWTNKAKILKLFKPPWVSPRALQSLKMIPSFSTEMAKSKFNHDLGATSTKESK